MGLLSELTDIKEDISDGVVQNKVSRFAYTEQAYSDNDVDGVNVYNVNQEQNIPIGTAGVMKVNQTVIEKGWRARASSITRMLMNHFLGRVSYNLNKANDMINSILENLISYMGQADGIATLDSNGRLSQLLKSDVPLNDTYTMFTAKGAYDFFDKKLTSYDWLNVVYSRYLGRVWKACVRDSTLIFDKIIYRNGLWLSDAYTSPGAVVHSIWQSDNGKEWTKNNTGIGDYSLTGFDYGNGVWVITVGSNGALWSEDKVNWTAVTGLPASGSADNLSYYGGLWHLHLAQTLYWSDDGKNWYACTGISNDYGFPVCYNNDGLWVAATPNSYIWWSTDGKAWTQGTSDCKYGSFVYYNNNLFVAGGSSGIFWSTDGKTWTQGTGVSQSVSFYDVVYVNGLYVGSCRTNGVYWSTDGKNWQQSAEMTGQVDVREIYYANGLFILVSSANAKISTDGTDHWSPLVDEEIGKAINSVVCVNGLWVCGSKNCICYSDYTILHERGIIK